MLDWAEANFAAFFPGPQVNQNSPPYTFRFYPGTQTYLGVANGAVFAFGPATGNSLARLGALTDFTCRVAPGLCGVSTAAVLCNETYSAASPTVNLTSTARWSCTSTQRNLSANGLPDHAVGSFPNADNPSAISAQVVNISYALQAQVSTTNATGTATNISGYALNGVKFEPGTNANCDNTGNSCTLNGNAGPWRIEALGQSSFRLGTDSSNGHVQPTGSYHYHGMPEGYLSKLNKGVAMTLVGWSSDGFPIYAKYGYTQAASAQSAIKVLASSYRLKTTPDTNRPATSRYPMGTFTQDYEYVAGLGDLDECNGRHGVTPEFPSGTYYYAVTDAYPYIARCAKGTPAASALPGAR